MDSWSSRISHSSRHIFRGLSVALSHWGKAVTQMAGMAKLEQAAPRYCELEMTAKADCSFWSRFYETVCGQNFADKTLQVCK
jgi:hypothetical protein